MTYSELVAVTGAKGWIAKYPVGRWQVSARGLPPTTLAIRYRWYRLRSLRQGDVGRIATLARRLEATTARPVGFVLDDAGRDTNDGWDDLIKEVEQTPGLLALAKVREEDVFLLATATRIRPTSGCGQSSR